MYKVPVITVEPVRDLDSSIIGTAYLDNWLEFTDVMNPIDGFMSTVESLIGKYQSIILYRQDVKRFADSINPDSSKSVFKEIKCRLRADYTVLKLRHNPRTLQYNGLESAFIVHRK